MHTCHKQNQKEEKKTGEEKRRAKKKRKKEKEATELYSRNSNRLEQGEYKINARVVISGIRAAGGSENGPWQLTKRESKLLGKKIRNSLHDNAVAVALLVDGRAGETGLLHPLSAFLEILKTFTGLGESLC